MSAIDSNKGIIKMRKLSALKSKNSKTVWNKGVVVGQRKAFTHKQVAVMRKRLAGGEHKDLRDLALLNTAIDTMLHASDLLSLRAGDVLVKGVVVGDITVKSTCLGRPVKCHLSDASIASLQAWIDTAGKARKDFIFTGRHRNKSQITPRQYSRLVKAWAMRIGLDPTDYGTESLRRTRAIFIMQKTGNAEAVRELLGLATVASVFRYVGPVKQGNVKEISKACEI